MGEVLSNKDIIIVIMAFITPTFSLIEIIIRMVFDNRKNKRTVVENRIDRDNNRKNNVCCKLLDIICELEICKTKIFDDKYYRVLLHHFNSVSLYANKLSRQKIRECRDYFEKCRTEYFSNVPSRSDCIQEYCEDEYNNITAAKYDYSETIMELKAGAIDSQKVIALLDELIETINGEITA